MLDPLPVDQAGCWRGAPGPPPHPHPCNSCAGLARALLVASGRCWLHRAALPAARAGRHPGALLPAAPRRQAGGCAWRRWGDRLGAAAEASASQFLPDCQRMGNPMRIWLRVRVGRGGAAQAGKQAAGWQRPSARRPRRASCTLGGTHPSVPHPRAPPGRCRHPALPVALRRAAHGVCGGLRGAAQVPPHHAAGGPLH